MLQAGGQCAARICLGFNIYQYIFSNFDNLLKDSVNLSNIAKKSGVGYIAVYLWANLKQRLD